MKKGQTLFLQGVLVCIGIGMLVTLIWFPLTEGRAVGLDLVSVYADPFIIFGYIASIPFFIALYQAVKLLGYIGQDNVFSLNSVRALRSIKYCALIVGAAIVGAGAYINLFHAQDDDPAGFLAMCIVTIFGSIVIATAAAVFERLLQSAVEIKAENDLTV